MTFDPYYTWLGIPPDEQPANRYRLLGIREFEANPDVIENACDQRMAHLRSLQTGRHGELSQLLLNEVAAAGLCLLDTEKKAAYDDELRRAQAPEAETAQPVLRARAVDRVPEIDEEDAAPSGPAELFPTIQENTSPARPSQPTATARRSRSKLPLWIRSIALVLLAGGVIVLMLSFTGESGDNHDKNDASKRRPPRNRPIAKAKGVSKGELNGIVIDDADALVLNWRSRQTPGTKFFGQSYLVDDSSGSGNSVAEFNIPDDIVPGYYELRMSYVPGAGRATNVKVRVYHSGNEKGPAERMVNQRRPPEHDELFHTLGIFQFYGKSREKVEINNKGANGAVVVDAIQLISVSKPAPELANPKAKTPFNPSSIRSREFLRSKGLTKQGAYWILEEGPLAKRVSSLAGLEKTYWAASNTLAVSLENLNKIRTQLKAYKRQAQRLRGLGKQPPAEIVQFINKWNPKVGSDQAIAANVDFRNLILAKIKARDELAIPFLKLQKEIVSIEQAYQRLAADPQVREALSKLAGKIKGRLGPSSGFKPTLAKFRKYAAILMTDEVPFYFLGRDTWISAVLNENTPLVFNNMPMMESNLIPGAVLKKAGIVVDPAALRVELRISFGDGKVRKVACRQISIPAIRFGRHVLKNLEFLVTPPDAADLGAVLGGSAFDDYRVEVDRDKFVFKIRPRDESVKGKQ